MADNQKYADKLNDDEFLQSFADRTFPISEFDHEAHVRLGWVLLKKQSLLSAISIFTKGLREATIRHGLEKKYNETVSWFFMILINERIALSPDANWQEFKAENQDLFKMKDGAFSQYYDVDIFQSDFAREVFVLPKGKNAA